MQIIDLSVVLDESTPTYPGDPATKIVAAGDIDKDGYTDHYVSFGTHVGTHIDAPLHMIKGGATLDEMPIGQFVGKGRYIKVDNEFDLESLKEANPKEDEIVLFHTGLSDSYKDPVYFEKYPAMPKEIAEYLVQQKVKMVGFDTCSPDHDEFIAHKILLGGNVLIIENLTNVGLLAGKEFTIYALPVKLQLDGAPARVIARIE